MSHKNKQNRALPKWRNWLYHRAGFGEDDSKGAHGHGQCPCFGDGQVGPSTARAVAARVPAPAHAHPRACPSCAFAHREAGMFTDGHEQATARAVRDTGTQRARKPNEHKQATARAVRGTGTQRARKPNEYKQATARAVPGTGTQRARKPNEHKQATARASRGHGHSTGTSTRPARALVRYDH